MKVLFLFIDGLGIRPPAPDNPVNTEVCPVLCRLMEKYSVAIDAQLGITDKPPQSATGQATMFTGVNCAKAMGRHCTGFPGPELRRIISKNNLFLELGRMGVKTCFANAYVVDSADELELMRNKSVTTVMAQTVPEVIRTLDHLYADAAVTQDITRETLQECCMDVPVVSPQKAAEDLFALSSAHEFTLFEFYQTDVTGHSLDYARACAVLRIYDRFLGALWRYVETSGITLVITSDHGNIENMSDRGHTMNRVPFVVAGPSAVALREKVHSLCDITPAITGMFGSSRKRG